MSKKLIIFFLGAQLYLVGSVFGGIQGADLNFRLGIVDFQKALNGVEEGRTIKAKLKKEFEAKSVKIKKMEDDLSKLQKDIEGLQQRAQSGLLKPAEMEKGRKLEKEFRDDLDAYAKLKKKYQDELSTKEMEATRGILSKLQALTMNLGRTGGYTMILERNESGLVYATNPTDLTEQLIQSFNKKNTSRKKKK